MPPSWGLGNRVLRALLRPRSGTKTGASGRNLTSFLRLPAVPSSDFINDAEFGLKMKKTVFLGWSGVTFRISAVCGLFTAVTRRGAPADYLSRNLRDLNSLGNFQKFVGVLFYHMDHQCKAENLF